MRWRNKEPLPDVSDLLRLMDQRLTKLEQLNEEFQNNNKKLKDEVDQLKEIVSKQQHYDGGIATG